MAVTDEELLAYLQDQDANAQTQAARREKELAWLQDRDERMAAATAADQAALEAGRQADFDALPFSERALIGAGKAVSDTGHALGNLIGMDEYDDQFFADKARRDDMLMSDAGGMTGYIGGKIAEFAVPSTYLAKGIAKGASLLPNATRAAQAVGGGSSMVRPLAPLSNLAARVGPVAAAEGVIGALDTPGGFADRAKGAAYGVAGAKAGEGLLRAGRHALTNPSKLNPFHKQVSPEARRMLDADIDVPPWKNSEPGYVSAIVDRLRAMPKLGNVINRIEDTARRQWNQKLVDASRPPTPIKNEAGEVIRWENTTGPVSTRAAMDVSEEGAEVINRLSDEFADAYDAIYAGRVVPLDDVLQGRLRELDDLLERTNIADDARGKVDRVLKKLLKGSDDIEVNSSIVDTSGKPLISAVIPGRHINGTQLKEAITELNSMIKRGMDSRETLNHVKDVREALEEFRDRGLVDITAGSQTFAELQGAYRNFLALKESWNNPIAQIKNMVTPQRLLQALKKTEKEGFPYQNHPLHQTAVDAGRVMGDTIPKVGSGTGERQQIGNMIRMGLPGAAGFMLGDLTGGAALAAAGSRPVQKLFTGDTGWQKSIRDAQWLEWISQALRNSKVAQSGYLPTPRRVGRAVGTLQAQPDEEN